MSFECPHCGWKNNELQPASEFQPLAVRYTIKCTTAKDLNRSVVRTEWAEVRIPEVEFEISKQSGMITTIEGLIDRAITGLRSTVAAHVAASSESKESAESVYKINQFIQQMIELKSGDVPFTFVSFASAMFFCSLFPGEKPLSPSHVHVDAGTENPSSIFHVNLLIQSL